MALKKSELYSSHWPACDDLVEHYEKTLLEFTQKIIELEQKANHHFERMGFTW